MIDLGYAGDGNITKNIIDIDYPTDSDETFKGIPSTGTVNDNNKSTMTQEEIAKSNANKENVINKAVSSAAETLQTGLKVIQEPIDKMIDVAGDSVTFIKDNATTIKTTLGLAVTFAIAYYGLGILGQIGRNIKDIKG